MIQHHAAIVRASKDIGSRWPFLVEALLPGAHVVLVGDSPTWEQSCLAARKAGLSLRNTFAVVSRGGIQFYPLFRKALSEKTLAAQVIKTGTSVFNINGTRIFTDWNESDRPDSWKKSGYTAKPDAEKIAAPPGNGIVCHPKGRWPTNVGFMHLEGCVPDNLTWVCKSGCPINSLDTQSGVLKNGGQNQSSSRGLGLIDPKVTWTGANGSTSFAGDSGGASRFYKQFADEEEILTYLKTLILPETGLLLTEFPS